MEITLLDVVSVIHARNDANLFVVATRPVDNIDALPPIVTCQHMAPGGVPKQTNVCCIYARMFTTGGSCLQLIGYANAEAMGVPAPGRSCSFARDALTKTYAESSGSNTAMVQDIPERDVGGTPPSKPGIIADTFSGDAALERMRRYFDATHLDPKVDDNITQAETRAQFCDYVDALTELVDALRVPETGQTSVLRGAVSNSASLLARTPFYPHAKIIACAAVAGSASAGGENNRLAVAVWKWWCGVMNTILSATDPDAARTYHCARMPSLDMDGGASATVGGASDLLDACFSYMNAARIRSERHES